MINGHKALCIKSNRRKAPSIKSSGNRPSGDQFGPSGDWFGAINGHKALTNKQSESRPTYHKSGHGGSCISARIIPPSSSCELRSDSSHLKSA